MDRDEVLELLKGFDVTKREQDGYYDATIILESWNNYFANNNPKYLEDYFAKKLTKDIVSYVETYCNCTRVNGTLYSVIFDDDNSVWIHPILFPSFISWIDSNLGKKMKELDMV